MKNRRFQWIFLDADQTLFDFHKAEKTALSCLLEEYGLPGGKETQALYHEINGCLWKQFELGEVTRTQLQRLRFERLLAALGMFDGPAPEEMNSRYLDFLSQGAYLLPGAELLCKALFEAGYRLAIITNGISRSQHARFAASPLQPYFEKLFVSEDLGCQKPQKEYFDKVCAEIGLADRSQALIVGDSLSSDIQGGHNSGIPTCWFCQEPQSVPEQPCPDYIITHLTQLPCLLWGLGDETAAYGWETLGENLSICVSPDHKFGTDSFLLADFAAPKRKETACDLGTGCGIIPLLWFRRRLDAPRQAFGVELQQKGVFQLTQTINRHRELVGRITGIHSDLKELAGKLPAGGFDVVTCNPPYKPAQTGILSRSDPDKIARHETACTIGDVSAAAARLLRFGGRLCLCQRPERLTDVLEALRQNGLEPKRLRFVQQRQEKAPWLFLVEARKGGKPFLRVEPPLLVEGEGGFSPELLRIYQYDHNLAGKDGQ